MHGPERADHQLYGIGDARKGRVQAYLGIGIELQRKDKISRISITQAVQQHVAAPLVVLASAQLVRPAHAFHRKVPKRWLVRESSTSA